MRILFFILGVVMLSSCVVKKTQFTELEMKWLDTYKEGDTLIFKSDRGEFDTSYIIKKKIFYPEYNPVEVHDKYLPQWGQVWYKNRNLKYHSEGDQLITIIKKEKNSTYFHLSYLYSSVTSLKLQEGGIEKLKKGSVYQFEVGTDRSRPEQLQMMFWDEMKGLIRYKTVGGVTWEKIN